jgi:mannosyl-oligosaccharide alpha-1,2-mannosidase
MAAEGSPTHMVQWYTETGAALTATCHAAYNRTKTGLGPDIMEFQSAETDGVGTMQRYYWLRPETVESYFYMWRVSGERKYRDWAWEAVQAIEKHCKCGTGYCGLEDVDQPGVFNPIQQSFFLAETLKYLYLIFSGDEVLPLNEWVFNTEAHPFRVAV